MNTLITLTKTEILRLIRVPSYVVPTLVFPIMFYAIFGLGREGELSGVAVAQYIAVSFAAYALISTALFSFGVTIASEKAQSWNTLLRTTPLNPVLYFLGKTCSALLQGVAVVAVLFVFAAVAGNANFDWVLVGKTILKLLLGMGVFVLLGLWIGYISTPSSAAGIANLIFLPLSFASGLFIPLDTAPEFIRTIAPYTPTYHYAQIGWATLGARDSVAEWVHWAWLLGYGVLFLVLVWVAYQRDEVKKYT